MTIVQKITDGIKTAMLGKDAVRRNTLRLVKAAFVTEAIALKKPDAISDEDAFTVIKRLAKQRKDSVEQFRKGGREDLAKAEESELEILEEFLPTQMSEDEIRKIAQAVKMRIGIVEKSKMGQLIGTVMKETSGRADGAMVKSAVEKLFS